MPRALCRVAVNNTITEINILNIFASSFILSCPTQPARLEGKSCRWCGPQILGVGVSQQGAASENGRWAVVRKSCV
jgi:hypothetical protein